MSVWQAAGDPAAVKLSACAPASPGDAFAIAENDAAPAEHRADLRDPRAPRLGGRGGVQARWRAARHRELRQDRASVGSADRCWISR